MIELVREIETILQDTASFLEAQGRGAQKDDLLDALEQMRGAHLRIDILGLEKAGKSSLVNALLGEARARVGENPTTSAPTSYPDPDRARVIQDHPGFDSNVFSSVETDACLGRADLVFYVLLPESVDDRACHRQIEHIVDDLDKPLVAVVNDDPGRESKAVGSLRKHLLGRLERPVPCFTVHAKWAMQGRVDGVENTLQRSGLLRMEVEIDRYLHSKGRQLQLRTPVTRALEHLRALMKTSEEALNSDVKRGWDALEQARALLGTFQGDLGRALHVALTEILRPVIVAQKHTLADLYDRCETREEFQRRQKAAADAFNENIQAAITQVYAKVNRAIDLAWSTLLDRLADLETPMGFDEISIEAAMDLPEFRAGMDPAERKMLAESLRELVGDIIEQRARDKLVQEGGEEAAKKAGKALKGATGKALEKTAGRKVGRSVGKEVAKKSPEEISRIAGKIAGVALDVGMQIWDMVRQERQRARINKALSDKLEAFYALSAAEIENAIERQIAAIIRGLHATLKQSIASQDAAAGEIAKALQDAEGLVIHCEVLLRRLEH
ncbi:MAG: GTPase [Pseudomonadota bacterium]